MQWLPFGWYEGSWRGSIDRCQPASFSGTHGAKKKWHKTRLRTSLKHIRHPVDKVKKCLRISRRYRPRAMAAMPFK